MDDFSALTAAERQLLEALQRRGIRFMLVGASAAILQGANTATKDIDLWFENVADPGIGAAVQEAGGIWVSGSFGMRPPQIGGDALGDRFDVVTHMHGLGAFADELAHAVSIAVDGLDLWVLSLPRIIVSKRAANRPKDLAAIPALEEALAVLSEEP
jgi:predicted nucleotidyltransferase